MGGGPPTTHHPPPPPPPLSPISLTGKDLNARRSAKQLDARGEKFRALKAKEAAKKAAAQAVGNGGAVAQAAAAPVPKAGAVATDPDRPAVPDAPPAKGGPSGGDA